MSDTKLNAQIEITFSSRPRNGADKLVLWRKRDEIERKLSQILAAKSQNVCIDGPTGSGKTSLALTVLNRNKQLFVWIPVTRDMDWSEFCEAFAVEVYKINSSFKVAHDMKNPKVSLSVNAGEAITATDIMLPWTLLKRIKLQVDSDKMSLPELREHAKKWKILDISELLKQNDICLLIDDFEKASDDLVHKVADLCKNLTFSQSPKCIIIGTGRTFSRLYLSDESLDGRLAELTVASFGSPRDVWHYINDGFARLGFHTPREKLSAKLITKVEADQIELAIFEAADGMPKYINEIALRICNKVLGEENKLEGPVNISSALILSECSNMSRENLSRCNRDVRKVEKELRNGVEFRLVLKAIFQMGANGVHNVDGIVDYIQKYEDEHFTYENFAAGFESLERFGLYVQTGKSGEVVFAKDPMFSHVLGLICKDPLRFNKDASTFGLFGQRTLPLFAD